MFRQHNIAKCAPLRGAFAQQFLTLCNSYWHEH